MSGIFINRVCSVDDIWDTQEENDDEREIVEIYVNNEAGIVYISRYKEPGILVFSLEQWEAINNFIKEEIEKADAETDS